MTRTLIIPKIQHSIKKPNLHQLTYPNSNGTEPARNIQENLTNDIAKPPLLHHHLFLTPLTIQPRIRTPSPRLRHLLRRPHKRRNRLLPTMLPRIRIRTVLPLANHSDIPGRRGGRFSLCILAICTCRCGLGGTNHWCFLRRSFRRRRGLRWCWEGEEFLA